MREILFRAKAINRDIGEHQTNYKNGDWVYGLVTRLYDERFENLPAQMTDVNGVSGIEVDCETIGQYTGLTDKNGKKIFEGDIVKSCEYNDVFFIKYFDTDNYPAFDCVPDVPLCECNGLAFLVNEEGCEVVGNIYDNPEQFGIVEQLKGE